MQWPDSFKIDQEILLNAGSSVQRLKMSPYFDAAHYILVGPYVSFLTLLNYFV